MATVLRLVSLLMLIAAPLAAQGSQGGARIEGVVHDEAGDPVAGARVTMSSAVRVGGRRGPILAERVTGPDGRFSFQEVPVPSGSVEIAAYADGFASASAIAFADATFRAVDEIVLVLGVPRPFEEITVTPGRTPQRVGEAAASVTVLDERDLEATAAATLDDALRQVPGFGIFRRTSSRTANPTTQGVSLRGTGASGAGRALVLLDGVPVNDPFGGWVAWGRVPREAVERVEVLRGGASDLYGSSALGGVVNVLTARPSTPRGSLEASYGAHDTALVSGAASATAAGWGLRLAGEGFTTGGYVPVSEGERGASDVEATSERAVLDLLVDRRLGRWRLFAGGAIFGERRGNGTPLQVNRTTTRTLTAGSDWDGRGAGLVTLRSYAIAQDYVQTFSAVTDDRSVEFLTRAQSVPSQSVGGSVLWAGVFGAHALVAGADGRETRGASDEVGVSGGLPTVETGAGGVERAFGVFARDSVRLGARWVLAAGARVDRWRETDGLAVTRPFGSAGATVGRFADRSETAFSPRVSVLYLASASLSLTAAGYRAFRAPTLNELYRGFRVGDVVTLANPALRAERLAGGEAGALLTLFDERLSLRAGAFWNDVTRPVANVTLFATPELITRRRENLGRLRSRGLEVELEARPAPRLVVSGGYLFTRSTVVEFPASRALEGLRVPQVPAHQLTAQMRYAGPARLSVAVQARASSEVFDDDLNRLSLGAFATLDAYGSYRLSDNARLFVAAENVFNTRYAVGRTPVETIAAPATVRFGLRLGFGE